MLNPDYLDNMPNPISSLYLEAENWTIQDIARRIAKMGKLTATAEYQLIRLNEIQQFDKNYKKKLAKLVGKTEQEIENIFKEASTNAYTYDKRLFEAKGIPYIPYEKNLFLQQLTASAIQQAKDQFENITRTMGMINYAGVHQNPTQFFRQTLDNVTMQVASGVTSYDEAIKRAIGHMVDNGITVVNFTNGRNERIEGVVRRNLLTAVTQMAGKITIKNMLDLDVSHAIVSMHNGARIGEGIGNHQAWQGKVYHISDETKKEMTRLLEE